MIVCDCGLQFDAPGSYTQHMMEDTDYTSIHDARCLSVLQRTVDKITT